MKKQDITTKATAIVKQLIDDGYIFLPEAMGSSSGQDWSVVLNKGDEGVAVSTWSDGIGLDFYETYSILVEKFSVSEWKADTSVYWYQSEESWKKSQEEVKFYKVGSDWYVTEDEYLSIKDKKQKRVFASACDDNHKHIMGSNSVKRAALKVLKRMPGYKRAKIDDIISVCRIYTTSKYFSNENEYVISLLRQPSKNASKTVVVSF